MNASEQPARKSNTVISDPEPESESSASAPEAEVVEKEADQKMSQVDDFNSLEDQLAETNSPYESEDLAQELEGDEQMVQEEDG